MFTFSFHHYQGPFQVGFIATAPKAGNYELCPAGNHPATIIGVVDVGHHEKTDDNGKTYLTPDVIFLIELAVEKEDGAPFVAAVRMTNSTNEKAALYDMARSLLGAGFTPEKFDTRLLANQPCMVQIVHKAGKGDKTYWNVASKGIKAYPARMPAPVRFYKDDILWSIDEPGDPPSFPWIPYIYGKTLKNLADESQERKGETIGAY